MLRPHSPRVPVRTLVAATCCAALGAGLLAGAGTATATPAKPAPRAQAPGAPHSKVVGYFIDWGIYGR